MEMVKKLEIDETCQLYHTNYVNTQFDKKQIVLCDTHRKGFLHYRYWLDRLDGRYKATTPFTVDKDGKIYKHYDPKYMSAIMGNKAVDMKNIYISLVNMGWLKENDGKFYNWIGDEFEDTPFRCEWRSKYFWDPYTKEQIDSVIELCSYLCNEHGIPFSCMRSNTIFNYASDFEGVTYKSNHGSMFTDINPSWDFKGFKNKLEGNE